jgi:Skp family chaperone for outer membrane proteins
MKLSRINTILILIGLAAGAYFFTTQKEIKIGYFDGNEVFEEFQMTKDLGMSAEATASARIKILDSLRFDLEILQRQLQTQEPLDADLRKFDAKRQEYLMKENHFKSENVTQMSQYNDQIFKQLRQYVDDFQAEKNYDMVIGLGSGGIASTAEGIDVSKILQEFINEKYQGS